MSLKKLYQEHFDCIQKEFGIIINKASDIDCLDTEIFNSLYDMMSDIEESEEYANDRGLLASDVVTYMLTLIQD